jgi:hypothetical protein
MTTAGPIVRWVTIGGLAPIVSVGSVLPSGDEKTEGYRAAAQVASAPLAEIISLRSSGALADRKAGDSAGIKSAFSQSGGRCLDGERRRYAVRATIRVADDLFFCREVSS